MSDLSHESASDASSGESRFQELLLECIQRVQEEGLTGAQPILEQHPQHADELRRRLAELSKFGLLPTHETGTDPGVPERLGEFRLLRRIGGGGMGVVYLAEQESLHREVALKLIRPEQLYFPKARERFQREVQTAARLKHPGIVPVYSVGESDGVPFFAMEHVDGASLGERLAELEDRNVASLTAADLPGHDHDGGPGAWVDACLELTAQVADALDHAHQRDVVHRDVKPSNILVTRDGHARLVDFGLSSTQESSRLTRTGALLGSLPYMSPEALKHRSSAADERSDVYSLGVTLFEMLTLRCPFQDDDAESTSRRILAGQAPPLRTLNPRVSWEAETVCLAAMERDPSRRYPTAAEFAADLRNVLARRPVNARRPGPLLRARRFAQRHPAWFVGAVLGVAILAATGFYAWQLDTKNASLARAVQRRDQAVAELQDTNQRLEAERIRAEQNFERALEAGMTFLTRVGADRLSQVPGIADLRGELLGEAERLYGELAAEQPDSPPVRYELARLRRLLGQFQMDHGNPREAEGHLRESIALLELLHEEDPDEHGILGQLCDARLALSNTVSLMGRDQESLRIKREAAATVESTLDGMDVDHPHWTDFKRRAAALLMGLGQAMYVMDRQQVDESVEVLAEARWHAEEALEQSHRMNTEDRQNCRVMLIGALTNMGAILSATERVDEAAEVLEEALAEVELDLEERPGSPELEWVRASILGNLALAQPDRADAIDLNLQAAEQLRRTLARDAGYQKARLALVQVLETLDQTLFQDGRPEEARPYLEEATRHADLLRRTMDTPRTEQVWNSIRSDWQKYEPGLRPASLGPDQ